MKNTPFHFSPTIPGSIDAFRWDWQGRIIEEVVLCNAEADGLRIAQMTVDVTKISAITKGGRVHDLLSFKKTQRLKLHGITTDKSTRTRSIMKLAPGSYHYLRFYIEGSIDYLSETREVRSIQGRDFIDFEFEKALEVWGYESPEFVFRFNFVPFQVKQITAMFRLWKLFQRPKTKLTY